MKRPLASKRPVGPFVERSQEPEPTGIGVRNGPIFTNLRVTTYAGDRDDSPTVTAKHVDFVHSEVKRIVTSSEVKDQLDFAGELKEFDVYTTKDSDITIHTFIRHPEDMLSIHHLNEVLEVVQGAIDAHEDLRVRSFDVVSREFVEQQHPELV